MRVVEDLRASLVRFLDGQEHGLAVLDGERSAMPWVYGVLQEIEAASPHRVLRFPHDFEGPDAYADAIAAGCLDFVREEVGDPTVELPEACSGAARGALARVQASLTFARDRGLPHGGRRIIAVVLAPISVGEEAAYAAFVREFLTLPPGRPPWFRRLRILVEAPAGGARTIGELPAWTCALAVDMSIAAMSASVNEDAQDAGAPVERRAWASLQAAALDAGRGAADAARERLYEVLEWTRGRNGDASIAALRTMALSGLGDVASLAGERQEAIAWYERALEPAGEASAALLLLVLARRLAPLYVEDGRLAEAEAFFDGAQKLAVLVPDLRSHVEALQGRGRLEAQRGALEVAAKTWMKALDAAREGDEPEFADAVVPDLAALQGHVSPTCASEIALRLGVGA